MGVRLLCFGNTYACVAKMLPQLKWHPLNDADINQFPLRAKKWSCKCDSRGFGGLGGRNVAIFNKFSKMMLNVFACQFMGPQSFCGGKIRLKTKI